MGIELRWPQFFKKPILTEQKPLNLYYKKISTPHYAPKLLYPPLLILHGLMGSSRTFSHVAHSKKIRMNRDCYLVDMRNHGNSPHSSEMNYELMKNDVKGFLNQQNIQCCDIMGFSMGGKIAMTLSLDESFEASKRIRRMVIVDVAPVKQEYFDGTSEIMNILISLDLNQMHSKTQIETHLEKEIPSAKMRRFIMTNIESDNGKFFWKCNLDAIGEHFRDILDFQSKKTHFDNPTLFIRGENSNAINSKNLATIRKYYPNYDLYTIKDASHWIHMENPTEFIDQFSDFINKD